MKVGILVVHIVLPMIASIGLYCYAFLSTRWNSIDNELIYKHNLTNKPQEDYQVNNTNIHLNKQLYRHAFRTQYGLFGYCLDYKWLYLYTVQQQNHTKYNLTSNLIPFTVSCRKPLIECQETKTCVKTCADIPTCPSYIDQEGCVRLSTHTRYYLKNDKCMWQSTSIDNQGIPRYSPSYSTSPSDSHYYMKRIRHLIMILLFVCAPLLTFMALLILFCINCVNRFYSIPFAFVSLFSLISFLSGTGGLTLFLYEWIQERSYRPDFTYESKQTEALIIALNPWIINVERLGIAFWLTVAAIGASLFTTILSCCFCCALQSDKSKLRIHVNNDKYVIVHTSPYDE